MRTNQQQKQKQNYEIRMLLKTNKRNKGCCFHNNRIVTALFFFYLNVEKYCNARQSGT